MKTYRDILQELFDTKIKIRVASDNDTVFSAFFYVPAEKSDNLFEFQFVATKSTGRSGDVEFEPEDEWNIIFLRVGKPGEKSAIDVFNDMTAKEVFSVFSGVKTAMLRWYKSQKPDYFAFTSKSAEGSRVKLYKKFAKSIAKKLNLNMISGKVKSNEKFVFTTKNKW